jgi:hypothetical protein
MKEDRMNEFARILADEEKKYQQRQRAARKKREKQDQKTARTNALVENVVRPVFEEIMLVLGQGTLVDAGVIDTPLNGKAQVEGWDAVELLRLELRMNLDNRCGTITFCETSEGSGMYLILGNLYGGERIGDEPRVLEAEAVTPETVEALTYVLVMKIVHR